MTLEKYKEFLGDSYDEKNQTLDSDKVKKSAFENKDFFNVLVCGATGVGKSALINAVFGDKVAESAAGKPITQKLEKYEIKEKGLVLWDTKGIEAKDYEETMSDLKEALNCFNDKGEIKSYPHIAWICIDSSSARVEGRDLALINTVNEFGIHAIVVFTKFLDDQSIVDFVDLAKKEIHQNDGSRCIKGYVNVNSAERQIMGMRIPVSGVKELLDLSYKEIPESAKKALMKAQKVEIEKRFEAMKNSASTIVHVAATAAGAAGASPIPLSDAPIIAAIQSTMIYKISVEFEIDSETSGTTSLVTAILGVTAMAQVGRTVVANALKFIPGAGTVIGGTISGTTAFAITEAIGHAYIKVLSHYFDKETGDIALPYNSKEIVSLFKDYFVSLRNR